jgi:hypothetical protein
VTKPRGKPSLRSTNAGSSAHAVASRNSTNAELTRPLLNPLTLKPKPKASSNVYQGRAARTRNTIVPPAMT